MLCFLGPATIAGVTDQPPPVAAAAEGAGACSPTSPSPSGWRSAEASALLLFPAARTPRAALRWHPEPPPLRRPRRRPHPRRDPRCRRAHDPDRRRAVSRRRRTACPVSRLPRRAARSSPCIAGISSPGSPLSAAADFDDWLYVEQEGLRRLFRRAAVAFARWALSGRRADAALAPLSRLIAVEPYFEVRDTFC